MYYVYLSQSMKNCKSAAAQAGFSTIELLIATALALMFLSAMYVVSFGDQSTVLAGETNAEATAITQELIERAQAQGRQDFNLVNSTSSTDGIYKKDVDVQLLPDFLTKLVTASTTWRGDHNQSLSVKIATLVTNLENIQSPNTCNSSLTNAASWKIPGHRVYDLGQLGINGNNGNGFGISDIQAFNKKLYVTTYVNPNTYKDTLFTFSIPSDPSSQLPVFLDSVDNNTAVDPGLQAISVASTTGATYVYAANSYGANFNTCVNTNGANKSCAQLQVFDVTDASNLQPPFESFKLPTSSPSFVRGSGGQAVGNSIFYKDGYVYLGLKKTSSGPEFNVVDVGGGGSPASPTNPIWKGGYLVGNAVNSIFVKGSYAYLATPNSENMTIIDIDVNSPTFMQRVGGYTDSVHPPNSEGAGSDHGEVVTTIGSTVYLGRTYGTNELVALNAANPASVTVSGAKDVGVGNQTSIYGVSVRDYLLFLITKAQFQIWNITNIASMQPWTISGTTAEFSDSNHALSQFGSASAVSFDCESNNLFLALASTQGNTKDMIGIIFPSP